MNTQSPGDQIPQHISNSYHKESFPGSIVDILAWTNSEDISGSQIFPLNSRNSQDMDFYVDTTFRPEDDSASTPSNMNDSTYSSLQENSSRAVSKEPQNQRHAPAAADRFAISSPQTSGGFQDISPIYSQSMGSNLQDADYQLMTGSLKQQQFDLENVNGVNMSLTAAATSQGLGDAFAVSSTNAFATLGSSDETILLNQYVPNSHIMNQNSRTRSVAEKQSSMQHIDTSAIYSPTPRHESFSSQSSETLPQSASLNWPSNPMYSFQSPTMYGSTTGLLPSNQPFSPVPNDPTFGQLHTESSQWDVTNSGLLTDGINMASAENEENADVKRARSHELYRAGPAADDLYHCPYKAQAGCAHPPTKLKCSYDKYVDSHLKPFRCKNLECGDLQFSSTACLLRHEREAHAMHGHGTKPHLCYYPDCERSQPGNGFPRRYNLHDHMRRMHDHIEPQDSAASPTASNSGEKPRPVLGKRRSIAGLDTRPEKRRVSSKPQLDRIPSTEEHQQDLHNEWIRIRDALLRKLQSVDDPADLTCLQEIRDEHTKFQTLATELAGTG